MKKLALIIGTILFGCTLSAKAQDISFESDDNKPFLGVRLGLDISCPTDWKISNIGENGASMSLPLFNNGAGFDLGAVYNIPLWKNLYFEPGLSIYYNTMGCSVTIADDPEFGTLDDLSGSIRRFGFRIPFQVGYRVDFTDLDFSLSAFTGPVLTAGLVGRQHATIQYDGLKESGSESVYGHDGFLNRVDVGWKIGVGAEYNNFVLQLSGTIGMCNMLSGAINTKYRDNNVALTIGYNFFL